MQEDFLLDSYDYDLPEEMIAQVPAQPVESAKLLVFSQSDLLIFGQVKHLQAPQPAAIYGVPFFDS